MSPHALRAAAKTLVEKAERAAREHLERCWEAHYALENGEQDPPESPALAPFCGCGDCCLRETLHAAWPTVVEAAGLLAQAERMERERAAA